MTKTYIYSINSLFNDFEITFILDRMQENKMNEKIDDEYRHCDRIIKEDENIYNLVLTKTLPLIPKKYKKYSFVELNKRIKLITYNVNDYFKSHKDGMYYDIQNKSHSEFSLLIYLNDDYDDGEIVINKEKIKPIKGSVIILNQNIYHECLKITKNIKRIIRMDIMYL
jgi:predicted 2-oxoglutarate/Fe(II)-dependent dioxygenase YbiX